MSERVAIVIIGRNEARRLAGAVASLGPRVGDAVYVDSRSTDASANVARRSGIRTVELPNGVPPSAAAARNCGFEAILATAPAAEFVQFMDGDCRLEPGWIQRGLTEMRADARLGAVWGWRREEAPRASIYNTICDLEWRVPPAGESRHFGGDALVRVAALQEAGGFSPQAVASEDHELSLRMRAAGWKIIRVDAPMTLHDSNMRHARQWWKRCVRRGAGYRIVWKAHHRRQEGLAMIRAVAWGVVVPLMLIAAAVWKPWALVGFAVYPLRAIRTAIMSTVAHTTTQRAVWGIHCTAASFPYAVGIILQRWRELRGRDGQLIEYR